MAQQFLVCTALKEDLNSVSGIHVRWFTTACSRGSDTPGTLLWFLQSTALASTYPTQTQMHTHNQNKQKGRVSLYGTSDPSSWWVEVGHSPRLKPLDKELPFSFLLSTHPLAGLKVSIESRLASNSEFSLLCVPRAKIKGVSQHAWPVFIYHKWQKWTF